MTETIQIINELWQDLAWPVTIFLFLMLACAMLSVWVDAKNTGTL